MTMQPINRHEAMGLLSDLAGEACELQDEIVELEGLFDTDRKRAFEDKLPEVGYTRSEEERLRRNRIAQVRTRAVLIATELAVLAEREYTWPAPRKYEEA